MRFVVLAWSYMNLASLPGVVPASLDCGFEDDFCSFTTGNPAWERGDSTPNANTGPSSAQEGSNFAFTEGTGNSGSTFVLTLASFEGVGVGFYYHM